MDGDRAGDGRLTGVPSKVSAAYEGGTLDIGRARALARVFLERVRSVHGLPVSDRAMGMVQLVVSELMTNACKYAPGPCLLELELVDDRLGITVWDSELALPTARAAEPGRVGQHGLEIVMAVSQSFQMHQEPVGKRMVAAVALVDDSGEVATGRP